MVAMVVVGNPANEDQAKAIPQVGKAKQVFAGLFYKFDASKTASKYVEPVSAPRVRCQT